MMVRPRKRKSLARFITPVMTLVILGYFGYHAMNGQYGIRAQVVMQKRLTALENELRAQTAVREKLEARVALVRDGTMEKDMVDEQIRRQLNMLREDEIALIYTD